MTELLEFVTSPWSSIGLVLLLFGLGPSALLRVAVRAYPATHPRRGELLAEFEQVPFRRRPFWVAALVPVCLDEGTGARRDDRREAGREAQRESDASLARFEAAARLIEEGRVEPTERAVTEPNGSALVDRFVLVIDGEEMQIMRPYPGHRR